MESVICHLDVAISSQYLAMRAEPKIQSLIWKRNVVYARILAKRIPFDSKWRNGHLQIYVRTCRYTPHMICVIYIDTWSLNTLQIWSLLAEPFLSYNLAANFDNPHEKTVIFAKNGLSHRRTVKAVFREYFAYLVKLKVHSLIKMKLSPMRFYWSKFHSTIIKKYVR